MELNKIYLGNCLDILKTFPDNSVDCCVTSSPYYQMRDYKIEPQIFGGDKSCNHEWSNEFITKQPYGTERGFEINSYLCTKCNAWKGQLGLEPTPELFVNHIVKIFTEVKRVLKADGTLWYNIGDCYYGGGWKGSKFQTNSKQGTNLGTDCCEVLKKDLPHEYLKTKDLVGIPWRIAFALQKNGWYLRSDIIWSKGSPMPESVTDRPTKSHEYIFLMSKSKKYYYDYKSIMEECIDKESFTGKRPRKPHNISNYDLKNYKFAGSIQEDGMLKSGQIYEKKNKRDVWFINTKPCKEAHFAVMPEELVENCILAGCPKGGIILDPFMGSGTVACVAKKYGRNYVGIELNPEYIEIANKRLSLVTEELERKARRKTKLESIME